MERMIWVSFLCVKMGFYKSQENILTVKHRDDNMCGWDLAVDLNENSINHSH